ncbi:conjugal transfer protein TraH [Ferrovum myxofaciens]|uniref:Conjugal transfer protein TraH n=1 Tax=Ferrovum myxofaciens TaxID=416213 RepID=A0A9E6MWM6_9PROT|nr:conjugal transfer protein TraH [Ferrovum myxofaciens]QKE37368.1 MAG: conjugal transfer protein TraH [Ferrovum myxofaciens]QWY75022.1 MAG: conjugal transfer protein TraH [Ferrovum myxofaciens]QWY77762.1 MAG: conjugal transfer protein TraH [Ferrovum myxofaciens]
MSNAHKPIDKPIRKFAVKKLTICLAIALFCDSTANAGLSGALNGMFLQNNTSPAQYSSMTRGGYTFGGASAAWPVQNINVIGFDPPHINGGCGGVDLYGGSFSFINGAQIVALFKQIVANAAGALFSMAIQSISPTLDTIMGKFQKIVSDMNSALKNTCAIGSAIGTSLGTDLGMSAPTNAQGVSSLVDSAEGSITDIFSGNNASPSQTISNITGSKSANSNVGNMTWKALVSSSAQLAIQGPTAGYVSANPSTDLEVLMSFLGTSIVNPGSSPTDTATKSTSASGTTAPTLGTSNPNGGPIVNATIYQPTLHITDLYKGSNPSNPKTYYGCQGDGGKATGPGTAAVSTIGTEGCTTLYRDRPWVNEGTITLAKAFMYGTSKGGFTTTTSGAMIPAGTPDGTMYSNGILLMYANCSTSGCGLNTAQQNFIEAIPAPIVSLIMGAETNGSSGFTSVGPILEETMNYIGYSYALAIGEAIRNAAAIGTSGSGTNKARLPEVVYKSLAEIDAELTVLRNLQSQSQAGLTTATTEVENMIKKNPNAYMAFGVQ